jgi:hypothetical protein
MRSKKSSLFIKYFLILFCVFTVDRSFCQTIINSNIFENTNWTLSGSPYIITSNTIVFEGAGLVIDPGVVIKFTDGTGMEFRGTLYAVGNKTDSITFTSNSDSPTIGIWKGLIFSGTTDPLGVGDQATMDYCKGMYADKFVNLDLAYHGPYIFRHCFFYKNGQVNYDGGLPRTYFTDCTFYENNTGLTHNQFTNYDNPQCGGFASHCIFLNNINGVDAFENIDSSYFSGNTGVALSPYGTTTNCIVENNNTGVKCLFNSANRKFTNNYVHDNVIGVWLESFFNGAIQFSQNRICNNQQYNIKYTFFNNADLSNNCWCSNDPAIIRSGIYDGYTPGATSGLITFLPVSDKCKKPELFIEAMCNESSTNLSSVIPGNTFQWQVNSGAGFINISESAFYSGVHSSTLQLNNISSEFSGYSYRCVVDGSINTPPVSLQFVNVWTGAIDSAWENTANWSCGILPDANTDVTISSGTVILNSNASVRSLTVNSNASFTVGPGYDLTITN